MISFATSQPIRRFFSRSTLALSGLVLGMGISTLGLSSRVNAAELLVVRFKQEEVTITTREIAEFVDTGFLPVQLQEFLDEHKQVPEDLRQVLTDRIKIDRKFVDKALDSSIGRFALLKLDELIQNSSVQEDLESLKTAIVEEVDELGSISLLGLIEAYPTPTIRLNLSGLETAYADAKHFIEDIEPALAVAKAFLQDIVCECETETANAEGGTLVGASSQKTAAGCADAPIANSSDAAEDASLQREIAKPAVAPLLPTQTSMEPEVAPELEGTAQSHQSVAPHTTAATSTQ